MSEEEPQPYKVFSPKEFTHDPVTFGSLMDFQYGESEVSQKEAEELLFEEVRGISCQNLEELGLIAKDLDFWLKIAESEQQPKPFRLYMNDRPASLLGAQILHDVGCDFEVIFTKASTLRVHDDRSPLPILVELEGGIPRKTLLEVKNFSRHVALRNYKPEKQGYHAVYTPQVDFDNDGWYRDQDGKIHHAEIWCFDIDGLVAFKGKIKESPLPVQEMLDAHWYTKRGGRFHDIAVWNLGSWENLLKKRNEEGHLISYPPPAVLFSDEVEAFKQGINKIVTRDHGCMYCVDYDGYFLKEGNLLRIWARMVD